MLLTPTHADARLRVPCVCLFYSIDIEFATTEYPALHAYPDGVNVTVGASLTFAPWTSSGPVFGFQLNCSVDASFDVSERTPIPGCSSRINNSSDYNLLT